MLNPFLLIFSIFIGFVASLLGIGGGVLLIPSLIVFGMDMHTAVQISLVAIFFTSLSASFVYVRKGLTDIPFSIKLELITVPSAIIASAFAHFLDESFLRLLFGLFLVFSSLLMLRKRPIEEKPKVFGIPIVYPLSSLAGFLSGLLGVGGGIIKAPALILSGFKPRKAAAISSFMVMITSFFAFITHALFHPLPIEVVLQVAPFMAIGAQIGARHRLKRSHHLWFFSAFLFLIGISFIVDFLLSV